MRLWHLTLVKNPASKNLWNSLMTGLVVRADSAKQARVLAQRISLDETAWTGYDGRGYTSNTWLSEEYTSCVEIPLEGVEEVIMTSVFERDC
jgi:hypothetical protein